jgi:1,4-dihydroxy-2-naphthoate octaprenyltransferase
VSTVSSPLPSGITAWIVGARPRTLPNSVVPVAVGIGCASSAGALSWWRAVLALLVSMALQVGVNYSNDYSDGVRGADAERVGPLRLTAAGVFAPKVVLAGALTCFAVAGMAGAALAASTTWWLLAVGAASIAAAWFYTGGAKPYGYHALGELAVFVFFGVVAVVGTAYVAAAEPRFSWLALLCAAPCGLLSVAVLVANNLRDIPGDTVAGKRTLSVVLGDRRSRFLYAGCLLVPYLVTAAIIAQRGWTAIALLALPLAIGPLRAVRGGAAGRDLIPVLIGTGKAQLAYGVLLTIGLAL